MLKVKPRGFSASPRGASFPYALDSLPPFPYSPAPYGSAYGAACSACGPGAYGAVSAGAAAYNERGVGGWTVRPGGAYASRSDSNLADAADRFQGDMGLTRDGAIGPSTLGAMIDVKQEWEDNGSPNIAIGRERWGQFWELNLILPNRVQPSPPAPTPTPGPGPGPGPEPTPPPGPSPEPTSPMMKYGLYAIGAVVVVGGLYYATK